MNKFKKAFLKGLNGMTIGVFINQLIFVISIITTPNISINNTSAFLTQFFISCLVGFYFASSSVIFELEDWSLLKQTIIHFVLSVLVYFPCAIYAKWMPSDLVPIILFILLFVFIYFVFWISFKRYWSKKVKEINSRLNKKQ